MPADVWVDVWDGSCPAVPGVPPQAVGENPCVPLYAGFAKSAGVGGFSQWCAGCNHTADPHYVYNGWLDDGTPLFLQPASLWYPSQKGFCNATDGGHGVRPSQPSLAQEADCIEKHLRQIAAVSPALPVGFCPPLLSPSLPRARARAHTHTHTHTHTPFPAPIDTLHRHARRSIRCARSSSPRTAWTTTSTWRWRCGSAWVTSGPSSARRISPSSAVRRGPHSDTARLECMSGLNGMLSRNTATLPCTTQHRHTHSVCVRVCCYTTCNSVTCSVCAPRGRSMRSVP